jgi:hypothetical protein
MRLPDDIKKQFENANIESNPQVNEAVLNELLQYLDDRDKVGEPALWRIAMKSKIKKIAVAAVLMASLLCCLYVVSEKSTKSVYALEETAEALHSVQTLHLKDFKPGERDPKEFWVICDKTGHIQQIRGHIPIWDSPDDGEKEFVWNDCKASIWIKKKAILITIKDETVQHQLLSMLINIDPKQAVNRLLNDAKKNRINLTIRQPKSIGEPIIVKADFPTGSKEFPESREVLTVNSQTKLVERIERYTGNGTEYQLVGVEEISNYNEPINEQVFDLASIIPAGVTVIDQTRMEIGLDQGTMSKEEIAGEVARQFFEALITNDYVKAGRLAEGLPETKLREAFGNKTFLKILSMQPARPHPNPDTGGLIVPSVVEVDVNGIRTTETWGRLGVRPVHGQPNRWTIFGGMGSESVPAQTKASAATRQGRELTDTEKTEQIQVKQATESLFKACSDADWDTFAELFAGGYPDDRTKAILNSLRASVIGEPFKKEGSELWYVPYRIEGEGRTRELRISFDQEKNRYIVRGGL